MLCSDTIYRAPLNLKNVVLGRTLPSLLDGEYMACANSHAFNQWTEAGWQSLSNEAFQNAVEEIASGLLDLQLAKGERIAFLLHSDINFCLADMGSLLAGLVNVPIDLTQTVEHIIFILRHTEAKALIISNLDLLYQLVPYLWDTADLKTVIVANLQKEEVKQVPKTACLYIPRFFTRGQQSQLNPEFPQCIQVFSLDEIRARGRNSLGFARLKQLNTLLSADDLATIIYIPGVTGEPQGVMLTHENLSGNALAAFGEIPDLKLGEKEVFLSFLPLTHVFARVLIYGHINYGHSIYFTTPNRVIKHLREVQPTIFATVPLFLEKVYEKILEGNKGKRARGRQGRITLHFSQRILKWALKLARYYKLGKPPQGRYALMLKLADRLVFSQWRAVFGGRIKYILSGGAALKADIANLFAAAGIPILQGYGLTETSSAITCDRPKNNHGGTVGVPLPGVEVGLAEDGEILTRSPYVTQGYYKNPEATKQVLDADGWLHTGDLGEFTKDGLLKITGLKKSRFKLSTGKYVTPQPLESKLEQSPLVAKAITVGSERKFCAMLIFPNLDNLRSSTHAMGINLPTEELLQHPCVNDMYQALVVQANCHLPYWSTVKRFQLIDGEVTVENGMLRLNQEVNRMKVMEVFAREIDVMYGEGEKKKVDEKAFLCPSIPVVACPAFAQSLTS
jgi:long-chain acyl-CoA synthetase